MLIIFCGFFLFVAFIALILDISSARAEGIAEIDRKYAADREYRAAKYKEWAESGRYKDIL